MSVIVILNKAKSLEKAIAECLLLFACWVRPNETHSDEEKAQIAKDNSLILSKYSQLLTVIRQELQVSAGKLPIVVVSSCH